MDGELCGVESVKSRLNIFDEEDTGERVSLLDPAGSIDVPVRVCKVHSSVPNEGLGLRR